jgi:hypothetical protein
LGLSPSVGSDSQKQTDPEIVGRHSAVTRPGPNQEEARREARPPFAISYRRAIRPSKSGTAATRREYEFGQSLAYHSLVRIILRDIREYNQSGKQTEAQPFDLSACVSYQIYGVFSYPHIDHYSLLNTAFDDNGEKLWPLWGRLSDAEFAQWATSDGIAPEPAPFAMYLQEGDLFVQRAGTVHTPYSITDILMTGTVHWDSRQLVQVLRQSIYERKYPKITNENSAKEFVSKLETIKKLWRDQNPTWPWGTEAELEEFTALLEEYKAGLESEDKELGWNCITGCLVKRCGCQKAGRACGWSCHTNRKSTRVTCWNPGSRS